MAYHISSGRTSSGINLSDDSMYISSGGMASKTIVRYWGSMYIENGGVANDTTIHPDGRMYISSGGTANRTTVNSDGRIYISSGGTANNTTANSYGYMRISSGGSALEIKENGGYVQAAEGADVSFVSNTISRLTLTDGSMTVHSNTIANNTTLSGYAEMSIFSGGVANNTTLNPSGKMYISSGGTANSTTVNSRGCIYISSGGVTNNTTLSGWDCGMHIYSRGTANSTTVNFGGFMHVSSGAVANSTTVNSYGFMYISSGGTAGNTTVTSSGSMNICSRGVANNTTLFLGGSMFIHSGGVANKTTVNSYGFMHFSGGGTANDTVIAGASMYILSGCAANNTTVNHNGSMRISSGGTANNTTVNSHGFMCIYSGGIANNTMVNNYGFMDIKSGGVHRGSLRISSGAYVYAYSGGVIDFTVAGRSTTEGYLITNLSLVRGAPTYTITVSVTQASGTYKLAQGAENFNSTISIDDGTTTYGSITVNGDDLVRNGVTYSLDQADGNLTLTVTAGITNLQATANGATWNGNAETVEYSQDSFASVLKLNTSSTAVDTYQMPGGAWQVRVDSEAQTGFTATAPTGSAAQIVSDADGNLDVFFVRTAGTWDAKHLAKHLGDFNGWQGTKERVALTGKNIITDIFSGSTDANILVLTDDANGDALFLDDAFTALGNQARLGNIDEIRAGAGNDVIDLTSPKFAYLGDEMTVYGGAGNDTIWANSGVNTLYGDAGNDRIIGGAGNDFIIGGAGNDSMHGGGGNDAFCFGANWGTDTVEQLATGKVILRFETGSLANWNATTKTYTNGANTVTVTGTNDIELYFGTASTLPQDAFAPSASEKIFEQLA